jgi:hypothetical protein
VTFRKSSAYAGRSPGLASALLLPELHAKGYTRDVPQRLGLHRAVAARWLRLCISAALSREGTHVSVTQKLGLRRTVVEIDQSPFASTRY